jgi:hypothetical protein
MKMEITELFPTYRGILESCWQEALDSPHGAIDNLIDREITRHFCTSFYLSFMMEASISTAQRWLKKWQPRYIVHNNQNFYLTQDFQPQLDQYLENKRNHKRNVY